MACAEGIVRALFAIKEAGGSAALAQFLEGCAATGEKLVDVALVGDVEDEFISRSREYAVERDSELNHAEVRADVAALARSDADEFLADLGSELRELGGREAFDVVWRVNGVQ